MRNSVRKIVIREKLTVLDKSATKLAQTSLVPTIFNPQPFLRPDTKEVVYILGMLWADGTVGTYKNCSIALEIINEDMNDITQTLLKTGKWNFYHRQRNTFWKFRLTKRKTRPI